MKKYKNLIITIAYLFIIAITFAILIFHKLSISNALFYLLESIIFGLIINLISYPFKPKINKIVNSALLVVITIFYIAQFVHYNFYDCFFSIYSLINGGQVFGFISAIIKEIIDNIFGILILLSILILTIILILKNDNLSKKQNPIILVGLLILNLIITISFIYIPNSNDIYSRKNLLEKTNSETKNTESFGLITAMLIDTNRYISPYKEDIIKTEKTKEVFKEEKNLKYNKENIEFDKLIKEEKNKDIKKIHNFFKSEDPTNKNEYTGIFKNKNLIFITAESFSFNIIDEELTPTLYKMTSEGITFSNFYTPIYYASTSDGEYTNLTGLLPKEGTWSYIASKNKDFPYTYAKVFKEKGYDTYSYHNGIYNFYDRNKVMPNLGYDKYTGCGNGLEKKINCNLWPQSDDEMISYTFADYKNSKNFMTYYMTISGHLSHNFNDNDMAKKHKDKVKDLKYSDAVKAYISATIDLDNALKNLLENLKKNEKLDDTVIVLVPDHYPYGLSNEELNELKPITTAYDKYKSGLIIYNSATKGEKIDKYSSNIDILPTILNMFGIKYDSRVIIGKDIMSSNDGIVIFNDRSFLTNQGFYNEKTKEFSSSKTNIPQGYIKEKRIEAFNKTNISSMILETNYYKSLKK